MVAVLARAKRFPAHLYLEACGEERGKVRDYCPDFDLRDTWPMLLLVEMSPQALVADGQLVWVAYILLFTYMNGHRQRVRGPGTRGKVHQRLPKNSIKDVNSLRSAGRAVCLEL